MLFPNSNTIHQKLNDKCSIENCSFFQCHKPLKMMETSFQKNTHSTQFVYNVSVDKLPEDLPRNPLGSILPRLKIPVLNLLNGRINNLRSNDVLLQVHHYLYLTYTSHSQLPILQWTSSSLKITLSPLECWLWRTRRAMVQTPN